MKVINSSNNNHAFAGIEAAKPTGTGTTGDFAVKQMFITMAWFGQMVLPGIFVLEVCSEAGWLPPFETETFKVDAAGLAHFIRTLRNNVHPGRQYRERPWSEVDHRDFNDAEAIYTVLFRTLNKVRKS